MPKTKQAPLTMTAKQAAARGYAIVSRASCWAARIDRPDWRDALAADHPDGPKWVKALGASAGDQYRRCKSRDVIVVPQGWVRLLPNSGSGMNEFVA
jgi:hypothetical protein